MGFRLVETSYGRPALDALSSAVTAAKADDPMSLVTVLVPGNVAGLVARRHLAAHVPGGSSTGVAGVDVTTLRRLAERLAAHRLAPRRPATRALVAAAWRGVLAADPGVFATVADHPATAEATGTAHRELRDVSPQGLDRISTVSPLTADLVRLHREVAARLGERWYDEADLLAEAAVAVDSRTVGTVVLHLPQELTRAEADLVRALSDTTDVTVVVGLTGVQRADRVVRRSLERLGLAAHDTGERPTATRVRNASDSDDEVRGVVRDLLETLRSTPAHRVAVLYARASPYARLLHEQLAAAGITVNGPGTRPITERGVVRALLETLDLRERDVPRGELFTALGNAPALDAEGARIPLSRWERISRAAGVVGGDDWQVRLDGHCADLARRREAELAAQEPREWLADRLDRTVTDTARLQDYVAWLRAELARGAALTTWRELADWCLALRSRLFGDVTPQWLPVEEQYAAAALLTTLHSLGGLDAVEPVTSLEAFVAALRAELGTSTPRVGRFGGGVLVAPLEAAVGLDLDVVHTVGLSEDLYPGRFHEDPLLPEAARDAAAGELAATRDRLDAAQRHLLAAFASAPTAVASFPRGDLRRSTRRLPSRFLLPTLRELSGDTRLAASRWEDADLGAAMSTAESFAGELLTTGALAGEQEWRVRQVAAGGSIDDVGWEAGRELLDAREDLAFTRFDGNLAGAADLPDLLIEERVVSPTALEAYAECPHSYFVQRMLGVSPLEAPEDVVVISPAEIGNLVHQVLDELVTDQADHLPGPGEPWSAAQRERLHELLAAKALQFQDTGRTGHARLWERELARIAADLDRMLTDDDAWRAEVDAAVVASEMPFGMKGRPAVSVTVPGGRILMRGSADMVDRGADGTLHVIDVKTGSRRTFAGISPDDPVVGGTKLQLPVYALAAREQYGDADTPVAASYWFVRRDRGHLVLPLTPEVRETYAATLALLARSIAAGVFPTRAPEDADFAWVQCPYCNPDGLGHAERRRQWEAKRADPALAEYVGLAEAEAVP